MPDAPGLHEDYLAKPSYTFLQTIGEGAAGICRLYRNDILGTLVVSKTVSLLGIPGGIARSEPRILETLDHKRLVEIREAQWTTGASPDLKLVTFTTDYCEGRSVHTALQEGHQFSVAEALAVAADVLSALAYLHDDHRLVHRDIKPDNVMLEKGRRHGLVGDLGSAAALEADGCVPAGAGTALYIAPEAATGIIDHRADLYSSGMVLLEMLKGPFPYDELDHDKIDGRLARGRRSMSDRYFMPAPWIPPMAASLVRSLCATDPNRRPNSAAAALRKVGNAVCVDWRRMEGAGLTGRWRGRWPPTVPASKGRLHEVTAKPITVGRYRGQVHLRAAWRSPSSAWRGYARLETRVPAGDAGGLAKFFRAIEAEAQAAPRR